MKYLSIISLLALSISSCSPTSPKLQALPDPEVKTYNKGSFGIRDPKVDILFVVDDSGSMSNHQTNLSSNIGRFLEAFFGRVSIDYHIGVVSTDMDGYRANSVAFAASLASTARLTPTTPTSASTLARTAASTAKSTCLYRQ